MMRGKFDEQLALLNNMLIEMGAQIETAIASSIEALNTQDTELARRTIDFDHEIDQKEKDIESLCLKLLLQQQPVARDLRLISSALKMITDMERIGDQSADIAEISILLSKTPYMLKLANITKMAEATAKMVTESIDAFVKKDLALANRVIAYDDVVDGLFNDIRNELIALIQADAANGEQAIDLIMTAKYLERIGDHATNIAEWVAFSITGNHKADFWV
jgi:phosphate transport system protein